VIAYTPAADGTFAGNVVGMEIRDDLPPMSAETAKK